LADLWNASDGAIQQLMQTQGEQSHVTSLAWIGQGNLMAVGTSDHKVCCRSRSGVGGPAARVTEQLRARVGHRLRSRSRRGRIVESCSSSLREQLRKLEQQLRMIFCVSCHEWAQVQIWDVEKLKQLRSMDGHRARVSSLSWNGPTLSSGGRDSTIVHHDVRSARHKVGTLRGHTQEVCGLKWSPSGTQLASGGNDNLLNIWDDRYATAPGHGACGCTLARLTLPSHPHRRARAPFVLVVSMAPVRDCCVWRAELSPGANLWRFRVLR
jgi:WD40 repeat protein